MNYLERDTYGIYKSPSINPNQQPNINVDITRDRNQGPGPALMGADTLIGNNVANLQEEDLGDIKEIMLDMRTGRVAYAVLSFGGFFGMGDKLFAVPWNALKLDTVNKRFVLDADKKRLENAPGFNKDNWPNMADPTWQNELHSYYGTKPYDNERFM